MGCRVIDDYSEYIAKYIPYFSVPEGIHFPIADYATNEGLEALFNNIEGQQIVKQAIIQQYNELILYHIVNIRQRSLLAPQCMITYDKFVNLPTIYYPKFRPLIDEDTVWKTSADDLPILLGTQIEKMGISFETYQKFIHEVVDLCEYYDLREDDFLLNPSNIGYHPLLGLRLIDYGLTNSGQLLDF